MNWVGLTLLLSAWALVALALYQMARNIDNEPKD